MKNTVLVIVIKIIWILLAVYVLCTTLYGHYMTHSPEVSLNGAMTMTILSMPSGLFAVYLLSIMAMIIEIVFSITIPDNYCTIIATWLILCVVGYVQWFKLVPILFQKVKAYMHGSPNRGK